MSRIQEARTKSFDSTETPDSESSMSLRRHDSFDPSKYISAWAKELRLPHEPLEGEEQEAEDDSFRSFLFHEDKESPAFLEKQTREREELREAKNRLSTAEELRQGGFLLESILFCGPILRQELGKWTRPVALDNYGTVLLRQCIMQLLLAFCQGNSDILYRHRDDLYPTTFLAEVVAEVFETKNVALLCVLRDICGYCIIKHYPHEVQDVMQNILEIMQPIYLLNDSETLLALRYLAESFVYDGYHGNLPGDSDVLAKREMYIRRHSLQIRNDLGPYDSTCLRYEHAMARVLLSHGNVEGAKEVLRDIFNRRETAFGEVHLESQTFVDGLLDDYCEDYDGEHSDRFHRISDCSIVDNLIKFGLKREAYGEVDTLAQECVFPTENTSSATEDSVFRRWGHFEIDPISKVQPRLASHQTPAWGCYWEDSRTYFCTWDQTILEPEYPEDPFPRAPIRLLISDEAISIDMSGDCLADSASIPNIGVESGPVTFLQNSEIWQLLESKRASGDWKILLALHLQHDYCKHLIQGSVNHLFWLFWDQVKPSSCTTPTVRSSW